MPGRTLDLADWSFRVGASPAGAGPSPLIAFPLVNVSDFDFDLPESLIAQEPRPRGASRLLVVDRATGAWEEATSRDLPRLLAPGDLLVANDTRVFPARLIGRRDPIGRRRGVPAARAGGRGALAGAGAPRTEAQARGADGLRRWRARAGRDRACDRARARSSLADAWSSSRQVALRRSTPAVDAIGHVPLPPYVHRADAPDDRERYQTVFARARGSVAAPTAGLHFDDALLDALARAGIALGASRCTSATARSSRCASSDVEDHRVDAERYDIAADRGGALPRRARGRRVVAVGTTTTRALESAAADGRRRRRGAGRRSCSSIPATVSRGRRARHELSPAAIVAAHARGGVRGHASSARGVPRRHRARLPLLQLWRCDADSMSRVKFCYDEFDLSDVRTYPLAVPQSKVRARRFREAAWTVAPVLGGLRWRVAAAYPRRRRLSRRSSRIAAAQRRRARHRLGPRRARDQDRPRRRSSSISWSAGSSRRSR